MTPMGKHSLLFYLPYADSYNESPETGSDDTPFSISEKPTPDSML
jgi:hypothetical protein